MVKVFFPIRVTIEENEFYINREQLNGDYIFNQILRLMDEM